MKKKLLSLMILSLLVVLLSGCSLDIFTNKTTNKEDLTTYNYEPALSYSTDGTKLEISEYGDYMEFIDNTQSSTLEEEYNYLSTKEKGEIVDSIFQESYTNGLNSLFDINNKVELVLNISMSTLEELNEDFKKGNTESYRECSIEIYFSKYHFHFEHIGIRQKGNTSRGEILTDGKINIRHYKLSFEETFDDEYRESKKVWSNSKEYEYVSNRDFFGLNKLDLRWNRSEDSTYTKEYYSYLVDRENNVLAQKSNPINLLMNVDGNLNNCGIYLMVESINKSFLKRNIIKSEIGGDLYKLAWGTNSNGNWQGAMFNSASSDLFGVGYLKKLRNGTFEEKKYTYSLKTNKNSSDHSTIINFISNLNNTHGDTIYSFMKDNSAYNEWISFLAMSYLLSDPDDLRGNYNNSYIYFTVSGKIIFMPVDSDRTFGSGLENPTGSFGTLTKPFDKKTGYSENNDKLINVNLFSSNSTTVKDDYINRINEIVNDTNTMSFDNFKIYYEIVKSHYEECLTLGDMINGETIEFSLTESNDITAYGVNLSMETYLNKKVETFQNYYSSYNK